MISWALMSFLELKEACVNKEMKTIPCTWMPWDVSILTMKNAHIITFGFPSIDPELAWLQWGKVWLSKFPRLSCVSFV